MKGIAQGMALTLRNFFSKSATTQYPYEKLKHKDRFRGQLAMVIDPETREPYCTACELCAKACPDRLITIEWEKVDKKKVLTGWQVNIGACMFCGLCVEACPFGALAMSNRYELAEYNRSKLVYGKERLLRDAIARAKPPKAPPKPAGPSAGLNKPKADVPSEKGEAATATKPCSEPPSRTDADKERVDRQPSDSTEEKSGTEQKESVQLQLEVDSERKPEAQEQSSREDN